jgi:hypothetical protein
MLMLMLARKADAARAAFADRIIGEPVGTELHGKTLGIVGMGQVGLAALTGLPAGRPDRLPDFGGLPLDQAFMTERRRRCSETRVHANHSAQSFPFPAFTPSRRAACLVGRALPRGGCCGPRYEGGLRRLLLPQIRPRRPPRNGGCGEPPLPVDAGHAPAAWRAGAGTHEAARAADQHGERGGGSPPRARAHTCPGPARAGPTLPPPPVACAAFTLEPFLGAPAARRPRSLNPKQPACTPAAAPALPGHRRRGSPRGPARRAPRRRGFRRAHRGACRP